MSIYENTELTPREHLLMEHDAEQARLSREHAVTLKRLEIELNREKNQAAIELKRLEAKWSSWLRLPALIIKLPVLVLLGLSYICAVLRKSEIPKDFWNIIKA
jgi:hypothetical protein